MTEKYIELYKKYRPENWDEIIGQDIIVNSLREVPINNKVPTSYMFFGPHGCGKTSTAFILAKALNCENLQPNGNPCNECETCKNIDNDRQFGVRYISMANSGSVDDVRKLVNEAQLKQPVKHPVWILDETHQLSRTAFDSLLIPMESETIPSLFIFCSTEPDKIPKTILSRSQVRTFNLVDDKTLARNLMKITKAENLNVTNAQIAQAVRSAGGSVRDSISNLETLSAHGVLPEQYSEKVLKQVVSTKYTDVFKLTNEMVANGQSFSDTAQRLYNDLSTVLLIQAGSKPDITYPIMDKVAEVTTPKLIIAYLNILGNTIDSMSRNTVNSRILFDIGLSKMVTIKRQFEGGK